MNRPRPLARIGTAALTAFACVIAAVGMLACEPTPTPTATPAQSSTPSPTVTPTAAPTPTLTPATATATPTSEVAAAEFVLDLLATVLGYRQDGTAEVELSVALINNGGSPAQEDPAVTVGCLLDGEPVNGCGGSFSDFDPPGRSGTVESTLRLRVPMGVELRAVLADGAASNAVVVPERIVGVERDVWACFSDRPRREAAYENDFLGGCGGWTSWNVVKWKQGESVRVWADPSGDALYVRILEETLDELAPLLNLDVEWVETEEEATLKAYVGVPSTRTAGAGFAAFCQDTVGCGRPDSLQNGAITSALMSVWLASPPEAPLTENEIAHATLHEALHALTAMHHRPAIRSVMSVNTALRLPDLSDSDEAMLRLHAHPLVRPGMTIPQVEQLIVYADELLDPPTDVAREDGGTLLAERAYDALLDAGSARFEVRGGWPDRGCEREFSGNHAIGRFARGYPGLVRFDGRSGGFVLTHAQATGWTGWWQVAGAWKKGNVEQVYEATPWRLAFVDPVEMLLNVITHADPGGIRITRPSGGTVSLDTTLRYVPPLTWARGVTLRVGITFDAETHHISAYKMHWVFNLPDGGYCSRYEVNATNGEYGVEIPLPSAISGS